MKKRKKLGHCENCHQVLEQRHYFNAKLLCASCYAQEKMNKHLEELKREGKSIGLIRFKKLLWKNNPLSKEEEEKK